MNDQFKILNTHWVHTVTIEAKDYVTGIVTVVNEQGDIKQYIGTVLATNENEDIQQIVNWGTKYRHELSCKSLVDAGITRKDLTHLQRSSLIHKGVGNTYGSENHDYSYHLKKCLEVHEEFKHLLLESEIKTVEDAIVYHDTIEDCGLNFNDVRNITSDGTAFYVYCVTDELGMSRQERWEKTKEKISANGLEGYVKLCDRIANCEYSIKTEGTMKEKYNREMINFEKFKDSRWAKMYSRLQGLFQ